MRRLLVSIGILLAVCCVAVVLLRSYNRNHGSASRTRTYETLGEAIEAGVIRQGWLPDFLPRSAYTIREKRNSEENTVIACFSFDPAEDFLRLVPALKEVPVDERNEARAPIIGKREAWFPDAITKGKFGSLVAAGFSLYKSERKVRVGPYRVTATWHLAINQKAGVCLLWFFQSGG